jgi:hypothetical protein
MQDVHIELASDISIFVGSNNSGKTSATQAVQAFTSGSKDKFSLYDFSSSCWKEFDKAGNPPNEGEEVVTRLGQSRDGARRPRAASLGCVDAARSGPRRIGARRSHAGVRRGVSAEGKMTSEAMGYSGRGAGWRRRRPVNSQSVYRSFLTRNPDPIHGEWCRATGVA